MLQLMPHRNIRQLRVVRLDRWEQHASMTAVPAGFPSSQGCRTITEGEIFLMNSDKPASLDSRYLYEHALPLQI